MESILIFDIPTEEKLLKLRVNRNLRKINASMLQFSVWSSDNIEALIKIALSIRSFNGSARILEEKFIF